jgi:predicted CopG family antitoxin
MRTVHLEISDDSYNKLKKQKHDGRYKNYSLLVEQLLKIQEENESNDKQFNRIMKDEKLIIDLIKQFYSDMSIVGGSDPNKNEGLQKFFKKRRTINND